MGSITYVLPRSSQRDTSFPGAAKDDGLRVWFSNVHGVEGTAIQDRDTLTTQRVIIALKQPHAAGLSLFQSRQRMVRILIHRSGACRHGVTLSSLR